MHCGIRENHSVSTPDRSQSRNLPSNSAMHPRCRHQVVGNKSGWHRRMGGPASRSPEASQHKRDRRPPPSKMPEVAFGLTRVPMVSTRWFRDIRQRESANLLSRPLSGDNGGPKISFSCDVRDNEMKSTSCEAASDRPRSKGKATKNQLHKHSQNKSDIAVSQQ